MTERCARPTSLKSRSELRYTKASSSIHLRKSDRIMSLLALKTRLTSSPTRARRAPKSPRNVHFVPGTVATYGKDLPPSESVNFLRDMNEDQTVAMILLGLRDHCQTIASHGECYVKNDEVD